MALPDTYKQVEYIQSTGTQYINTGFTTTPNTKVELDFQFTSLVQSACSFGNTGSGTSNTGATFCWYLGDSATHFKLGIANGTGASDVWNNTVMNSNTNRYVFVAENGIATIYNTAGVQQATKNTVRTISQNCKYSSFLFAAVDEDTGSVSGQCSGKLYSCKIYNSGILTREFVPVIRKSDNKPGLYDLVNNVFYTNAGTGEFTYKEYAESGKIKKITLGTSLIRPVNGHEFQGNLTQISSSVGYSLFCVPRNNDLFLATGPNSQSTATINGLMIKSDGTVVAANKVTSPVSYSWGPTNVSPQGHIFIRSESGGGIYNYNTTNLTIGSKVCDLGSGMGNSGIFSRDGKMMSKKGNPASSAGTYGYYTISGNAYTFNYFPFSSGVGYTNNVAMTDGTILVRLPNGGTSIYACKIVNGSFTYSIIGTMPSGYGNVEGCYNKVVYAKNSTTSFYLFNAETGVMSSAGTIPASHSAVQGVSTGDYVLISGKNSSNYSLYVYHISNLSTPIWTGTLSTTEAIRLTTTEGLEGFLISPNGGSSYWTYFLS